MSDGLYRVVTPAAVFGLVVAGGRVVRCAPYARSLLLGRPAAAARAVLARRFPGARLERIGA